NYWGIQNIREKIDGDYIESNYGISKNDIDLIETHNVALEGTDQYYKSYLDSLELINPTDPETFSFIEKHIDVQEYLNYLSTEIERAKIFIEERQRYMAQHMADFFGLDQAIQLRVFSNINEAGTFNLNNVTTSPVVNGPYFKGQSYTIKAIPATGFKFNHWNIT